MDGGQVPQGGVALGLALHVLGSDGVQGHVGDGVAGAVDHVGPAVGADLDGGDDVVEEGLGGHEVDHAHDAPALGAAGVDGGRHYDGELAGDLADQGLGHVDRAAHGLLDILAVGVVLPVEDTDAVGADDVAPLEVVHVHARVDDGALLRHGHCLVGQLRDAAGVHGHIPVGSQLLLDALRRQHGGLAEHLVHRGDGAPVVEDDAGRTHRRQGDEDCGHQAHCDFPANTLHVSAPQFFDN